MEEDGISGAMRKSIHSPEYQQVLARLVAMRQKAGLTQRDLAKTTELRPGTGRVTDDPVSGALVARPYFSASILRDLCASA